MAKNNAGAYDHLNNDFPIAIGDSDSPQGVKVFVHPDAIVTGAMSSNWGLHRLLSSLHKAHSSASDYRSKRLCCLIEEILDDLP